VDRLGGPPKPAVIYHCEKMLESIEFHHDNYYLSK
jgi:hypothetical protein